MKMNLVSQKNPRYNMQTKVKLKQEGKTDSEAISNLIMAAYKDVAYSNKREQLMVDRLRKSSAFIPELSIVAEDENENLAGHILLTKIYIQNQNNLLIIQHYKTYFKILESIDVFMCLVADFYLGFNM